MGRSVRWGFNSDLTDVVANYLGRGAEVVVIECDGVLVATGALVPDDGGSGQIVRVAVARSHRRQGLATRVVGELVERARRRKMAEVRVLTDTPWRSAVELYRSCHFSEVGEAGGDTHFVMHL